MKYYNLVTILALAGQAWGATQADLPKELLECSLEGDNLCQSLKDNCNTKYYYLAKFYFCTSFYPSKLYLCSVCFLMIALLLWIFISLSILVSKFFFPSLIEIAETLRVNRRVLSFVLIPFANGISDICNLFLSLRSNSIDLVLGQLIGSLFIILSVIIGIISIVYPFSIHENKWIVADMLWVFFLVSLAGIIFWDGKITRYECLIMSATYILYLVHVFFCNNEEKIIEESQHLTVEADNPSKSPKALVNMEDALNFLSREDHFYIEEQALSDLELNLTHERSKERSDNENLLVSIIRMKLLIIDIIIGQFVPGGVTRETEYYTCAYVYCFTVPCLINILYFHFGVMTLVSCWLITTIAVKLTSPLLAEHSKFKRTIAALLGITMSSVLISELSFQVLLIFKNLGLIMAVSEYLLGLLVFAIGNTLNDMVTNITIAKIDPMLGLYSCLGSPVLLVLLGIGMNGSIVTFNHDLIFQVSKELTTSMIGLMVITVIYLIYIPLNNWHFDKKLGFLVLSIFCIVIAVNFYWG